MTLELLTRSECPACAVARADLGRVCADLGLTYTEIDVDVAAGDGKPELRAEYGDRLPVVLLGGVEHSYWEVDEPRLRADIAAQGGM